MDLKIKEVSKVFTTDEKIRELLNKDVVICEKYDGTKLSLIRTRTEYDKDDYTKNWIVSYKGNVIYPSEFNGLDVAQVKKGSIGTSQYKIVHEHLRLVHKFAVEIPCSLELTVEFIMRKPTLTRDYETLHDLIVIGTDMVHYEVSNGIISTTSNGYSNPPHVRYAAWLKMKIPKVLYSGKLGDVSEDGRWASEQLDQIRTVLLNEESEFGGKMEGVVIRSGDEMYKMVQSDQYDKDVRLAKKNRYRMDANMEKLYWAQVHKLANMCVASVTIEDAMNEISEYFYSTISINSNWHDKKTIFQIRDDLFLTAKLKFIRGMHGNNGALFVGRFAPPTVAHMRIVEEAGWKYDTITVNMVKSKESRDNPFPWKLRERMWQARFPNLVIQSSRTGNLVTIIHKAKNVINTVIAGTDRVETYTNQLKDNPDISVHEYDRIDSDTSAGRVRKALLMDDFEAFREHMHSSVWDFYDELREHILKY